jgi:hypothetical protein
MPALFRFSISSSFLLLLAGTASWEALLRTAAQRASASSFDLRPFAQDRAARLWLLQNQHNEIFGASSKSSPWPGEQEPTRFRVPRAVGAEKEKTKMTNEIEVQQANKALVSWAALLDQAVARPGFIHEAYSRFHNHSLGNQLLALLQCHERGIQPGPLATFPKWKELGRSVKKGQKALNLCMPITCKRTKKMSADHGTEQDEEFAFTHFTYKPHWFVLSQTEGADYRPPCMPEWAERLALETLTIEREEFAMLNGNTQGYAQAGRKIAKNPMAVMPHKTLFHELSHVLLGHCDDENFSESEACRATFAKSRPRLWLSSAASRSTFPASNTAAGISNPGTLASSSASAPLSESSARRIKSFVRAGGPTSRKGCFR